MHLHIDCLEPRTLLAVVPAFAETDPVHAGADDADDTAVWIHPTDPLQSVVVGTDKGEQGGGGLAVYDLDGNELQYIDKARTNNVDIRYNFPLDGERIAVIAVSDLTNDSIALYTINPKTRKLVNIAARTIFSGVPHVYGITMYHSHKTDTFFVFINDDHGRTEQWELFDDGNGKVDAELVRDWDAGVNTEGMVTDDELGFLYISEENVGIWKYGAEPDDDTPRIKVDGVNSQGELTPDVEGLAIYYGPEGTGYLIASSQGSNDYVVYERGGENDFVERFEIGPSGNGVDGVNDTDGIEVLQYPLGDKYPDGIFIAQDFDNPGEFQNYKFVRWGEIADILAGEPIDGSMIDPRVTVHHLENKKTLHIFAEGGDDEIIIRQNTAGDVVVRLEGRLPRKFAAEEVEKIRVWAGAGDDAIIVKRIDDMQFVLDVRGQAGNDTIEGTPNNDTLLGGKGSDTLLGRGGDDSVLGQSGDDEVKGGPGHDTVAGHGGDDILFGQSGDDFLIGGVGSNQFFGGTGLDTTDEDAPGSLKHILA